MYFYSNASAKENQRKADVEDKYPEINTWKATWSQMNPFADWAQAQDAEGNVLHDIEHQVDANWKLPSIEQQRTDGLNFMSISQAAEDGKLNSQAAYDNLVARVQWDRNTQEVLSANHGLLNFAAAVPAFITNPINIPELGLAAWTGGASVLGRVGAGAVVSGLTGYADEEVRQSYSGLVDQEMQANVTAFAALFGGAANGVFGRRIGDIQTKGLVMPEEGTVIPPGHALNTTNDIKVIDKDGNLMEFEGTIPEGSSFSYSLLGSMYSSSSNSARQVASRLQTSGAMGTGVGTTFMGDTAQHVARTVQSYINKEQGKIKEVYRKSFPHMNEGKFNELVYDSMARRLKGEVIDGDLGKAVDAFQRAIDSTGKAMDDVGMPTRKNYLQREWNGRAFEKMGRLEVVKQVSKAMREFKAREGVKKLLEIDRKIAEKIKIRDKLPKKSKAGTPERKSRDTIRNELKSLRAERKSFDMSVADSEKRAGALYDSVTGDDWLGHTNSLKRRSIDIDEADVLNLLNRNAGDVLSKMSYRVSGRVGTHKALGFHTEEELKTTAKQLYDRVLEETGDAKHATKMADYFERNVRLMWGTQMKSDLPAWGQMMKKGVMDLNFATIGGGFAATAAMGELALPIAMAGFKVGMRAIKQSLKDFKKIYREEESLNAAMAKIQLAVHGYDKTNHSLVSRVANDLEEGYMQTSWLNEKLAKATEFVSNTLPLSTVTTAARNAIGMSFLDDLFYNPRLLKALDEFEATGVMNADLKKLTRLQFDVRKLREIQAKADEVFTWEGGARGKGDLLDYDLTKLGEENRAMIDRGLSNASDLNILMGNKEHLPVWWSNPNNYPLHLMTQFMSYPLHAYEALLLRGWDEKNAAMVVGIVTSALFTGLITSTKEELQIQAGFKDEADRKYDLSTTEGFKNMTVRMLNTNSILAPMSVALNTMSSVFTGEALGSDYRASHIAQTFGGPTVNRLNDLMKALHAVDLDPTDANSNAWKTVYGRNIMMNSGLPLYTTPIIGDGLKALNEWAAGK
jgi:hypothetical protein